MKKSSSLKSITGLVVCALFAFLLFFNVSLIQNDNGDRSISLATIQTAQAQDGESCSWETCEDESDCEPYYYEYSCYLIEEHCSSNGMNCQYVTYTKCTGIRSPCTGEESFVGPVL